MPHSHNNFAATIARLRALSQLDVQSGWRYCDADSAIASVNICNWPVAQLNEKGHIAWPGGKQVLLLGQRLVIPHNLHGYPVTNLRLLLGLTWWAEDAQIFVNGKLVGRGDLFDCRDRVLLSSSVTEGDEFLVVLRLVSPEHDRGALVQSVCLYEAADSACFDPGFVAAELEILQNLFAMRLQNLNSQYLPMKIVADRSLAVKGKNLQSQLDLAVDLIDWSVLPDREMFDRSLSVLRQTLLGYLQEFSADFCDASAKGINSVEGAIADAVSGSEEIGGATSIYIGEVSELALVSGGVNLGTAEDAENAEGGSREEISGSEKIGDATSIYIEEVSEFVSVSGDVNLGTAEDAENAEGEIKRGAFNGGESGSATSIYMGEVGELTSIYIGKISLLGHAHLDLAWLWPVPETWEAAQRTFESVLQLQSEFPELIFCHSTPALYAWIEEHRPDLFTAIKQQVAAGRWEVVGGMWVEPDLNLISGESMVRQVVCGQRYTQEKFGELMRVAWLPDTFGFGWQLPQILRQGGVDYFVTQKLRWNDTTEFPYDAFLWEGLDGSQIFSVMSGPIGEGIESVKVARYVFDWQVKTGLQSALWLPGVGDHGGGPTRDMLEVAKRWQMSPFFPRLEFAKAIDYLSAIEGQFLRREIDVRPNLPVAETVENLDAIELPNFATLAETSPKITVSESDNSQNLSVSETVENLSAIELANSPAFSETSPQTAVSKSDNSQNKPVSETAENLPAGNFETSPQTAVLRSDKSQNLPVSETVDNLSAIELPNFPGVSETSPQTAVLKSDKSQNLPAAETGSATSIYIGKVGEITSKTAVSKSDNYQNKPVSETAENLPAGNFETSPQNTVLKSDNSQNLPVSETVEDLSAIELANSPAFSETSPQTAVSKSDNSQNKPVSETVENMSAIELLNFPAISETSPKTAVAKSDNSQNLPAAETGTTTSIYIGEVGELTSKTAVSESNKSQKLPVSETVESLSAIEPPNSPSIAETSIKIDVSNSETPVLKNSPPLPPSLPIWQDELYLEFHRGCYTTRADQKRQNRRCEDLLYQAELLSALATICAGAVYPKSELETAWKQVLFNQFHDILPGSAIAPVYADANLAFARVDRACREIILKSLDAIASRISLPASDLPDAKSVLIFNPLNWSRSEVVAVSLPDAAWQICDLSAQCLESQIIADDRSPSQFTLLFLAADIPALGYRMFWLCRKSSSYQDFPGITQQVAATDGWKQQQTTSLSGDRHFKSFPLVKEVAIGENSQISSENREHQEVASAENSPVSSETQQYQEVASAENSPVSSETWQYRAVASAENSPVSSETKKQSELSKLTYGIAQKNTACQETHFVGARNILENDCLRATIDGETGNLLGIWDKTNNREVLNAAGGDRLEAFQDSGQYWDAWNIDPNYQKHQLPEPQLKNIYWVERGTVRQILRVIKQIGKSEFQQDYIVEVGSPLLKIKTVVDWQEQHVLVKTAFGFTVAAEFATCEIPCGAIERPTRPQTAAEKAKWEVPILRWVDLSDGGFGVSLLNDCKYGCDIQPDRLRLTLLRGSTWPDPEADRGIHEFTYAVYPHAGNWQQADTVRRGYEFNVPLLVKMLPLPEAEGDRSLPAVGKLLDLSAANLVLMAFKQSEDNPDRWILRCYESQGKPAMLELSGDLGLEIVEPVDLLERPTSSIAKLPQQRNFPIAPWKIASFLVMGNG
ncbi:MAG: glycoside hydrolase family 38 C-terminal domain-containing protein [Microcoleus sp.]